MIKQQKTKKCLGYVLWLTTLLALVKPLLGGAQSMIHIRYDGTIKLSINGLSQEALFKKNCEDMHKAYPTQLIPPFKVVGKFDDVQTFIEDVYISANNAYYAKYKQSHKVVITKTCQYKIVPRQEIDIVHYKERSAYKFDSTRPSGEQWTREELPNSNDSKTMAKVFIGVWNFNVRPTGKQNKIADLFCEIEDLVTSKSDFKGTFCTWKAKPEDHLNFLGNPLELILSSQTQIAKGAMVQKIANSVNFKEAYDRSIFQVPSNVKNMPFYADEPNYTHPDSDDSDLDCKAEKIKTGIDPCANPADALKWCAATKIKLTGKDPCVSVDEVDDSE